MIKQLSNLKKEQKKAIVYLNDLFFLGLSFYIFISYTVSSSLFSILLFCFVAIIYSIFMEFFGGFSEVLKNYTAERLLIHAVPILLTGLIFFLAYFFEDLNEFKVFFGWIGLRTYIFTALAYIASSFTLITLSRIIAKIIIYGNSTAEDAKKVYIFGVNDNARDLYSIYSLENEYEILGFITLDKNNQNRTLFGKNIISFKKAIKIFKKNNNFEVFLALGEEEAKQRPSIINDLSSLAVTVKSIPSYSEYLHKNHLELEDLSVADILGREEIQHNRDTILNFLQNKKILITGAGGSIGSEISKLLAREGLNIIFVDSSELNLYKLEEYLQKFRKSINVEFKLADVRDYKRMDKIISDNKPDIIYHAAAYKHVPIIERNMNFSEAIKTNIFGSLNLARLAIKHNLERMIFISTDKAVRPTNLMGATKRIAERAIASLSQNSTTVFSSVRFGNVLQSSGSVIPKFKDQIEKGGPVTVTDKEMTRYFMTIPEAAELVVNASFLSDKYSTYLLKMGEPVKIYDLAKKMINLYGFDLKNDPKDDGIEIIFSGLRPGEKIFEELLVSGDEEKTENELIFRDASESKISIGELETLISSLEECVNNDNLAAFKNLCKKYADYREGQ